ncbi:hypothetical protein PHJA_002243400 [Phtheirospermum japonicum]|uniref:Uncharacterized protein n=1 Tax=Phtheirospermum japonicum TaxID=374723 RepID=A0A830CXY8_9LAMI|nr:hypothetical protein PHJA_002243400 [Phtheirospermum japonicum]
MATASKKTRNKIVDVQQDKPTMIRKMQLPKMGKPLLEPHSIEKNVKANNRGASKLKKYNSPQVPKKTKQSKPERMKKKDLETKKTQLTKEAEPKKASQVKKPTRERRPMQKLYKKRETKEVESYFDFTKKSTWESLDDDPKRHCGGSMYHEDVGECMKPTMNREMILDVLLEKEFDVYYYILLHYEILEKKKDNVSGKEFDIKKMLRDTLWKEFEFSFSHELECEEGVLDQENVRHQEGTTMMVQQVPMSEDVKKTRQLIIEKALSRDKCMLVEDLTCRQKGENSLHRIHDALHGVIYRGEGTHKARRDKLQAKDP